MASSMFDPVLESWFAAGAGHAGFAKIVDLEEGTHSSDIQGIFVSSGYTLDRTDQWYSDILSTAIVQNQAAADFTFSLANTAVTQLNPGIKFDADDLSGASQLTGVGDGTDAINAIILFDDQTASDDNNPVICYIDTGTGFGLTPSNSVIEILWASGGIFTVGV